MGLNELAKAINKTFGDGSIVKLTDDHPMNKESISTGSLGIDIALGGGLPKGRIIEVIGGESSGKSTLALHALANAQSIKDVLYVDAENAFDPAYATNLGVNLDKLWVTQPATAEQAFETIESFVESGDVSLIIIDSVAALTPKAELEGDSGDSNMGLMARLMGQHLRKVTGNANKTKTTLLYINQIRYKLSILFGNPETTTGGNALKYFSSVRLDMRLKEKLKDGSGILTRARVIKNKTSVPFKEAEVEIRFGKGIDSVSELVSLSISREIVKQSGAWISYGSNKWNGKAEFSEVLRNNKQLCEELTKEIVKEKKPSKKDSGVGGE